MSLLKIYAQSYKLSPERQPEFFDIISDYYYTEEVQSLRIYCHHDYINRLTHVMSVTYMSYALSKKAGLDYKSATIGALLHDLFFYDWHDDDRVHRPHGYKHPRFALQQARKLTNNSLTHKEENIILRHMFPLTLTPPSSKEGVIVSLSDKYCATVELIIAKHPKLGDKIRRLV